MINIRNVLLGVVLLFICVTPVFATTPNEQQGHIDELQRKITELQGQENSLSKQINLITSQISLTTLRLSSIKDAISKLSTEITELNDEIERLETLKTKRLELVLHRIPETYKRYQVSQFGVLLFSRDFSDFMSRIKYLSHVQDEDTMLYRQLQNVQDTYSERKDLREKKKVQHESLKEQFEQQSWELDRQKREKQILLEQTKNSESVYQKLLAQALAEKTAIEQALIQGVSLGPVKQGDPIALVGNTGYPGCSTGAHLHFEMRKNNSWTDPGGYLSSKSVIDDQNGGTRSIGSGNWGWPLQDTVRVTQYYGKTPYSWRYTYSGGIHTGIDMISTSSTVIRAPKDGTLYSSSQSCGSSSIIKIKYIEHADGVVSLYLHVQ